MCHFKNCHFRGANSPRFTLTYYVIFRKMRSSLGTSGKSCMKQERLYYEDVICSKATPSGASAIAVIRVSGDNCWSIIDKIFLRKNRKKIENIKSHKVYYGFIMDGKDAIDSVVLITFGKDKSFTGEESFEIDCHGSELISQMIINILLKNGARLADPGEYSKRAFLNGKIDLSEAEAIMDVVNASTKQSAIVASRQLNGAVRDEINRIKDSVSTLLTAVEALIDYPEEDISPDVEEWMESLALINSNLESLLLSFERGRFFREGVRATLIGKTNSGKSTIFNSLLNEDKAIVSDIHGTTRDYLDAIINIKGFGVRLYDTAGLRYTTDPVEMEGTKRAVDLSQNSDVILYVLDASLGLSEEDKKNIMEIDKNKNLIVILNKIDLIKSASALTDEITDFLSIRKNFKISEMSAKNRTGIELFNNNFISLLTNRQDAGIEHESAVITNERHKNLLDKAHKNIINSFPYLRDGILDIAAFELRESLDRLGEITGEVTREDIINKIFSNFCVGK